VLLPGNPLIGGEQAEGTQALLDYFDHCPDLFVGISHSSESKSAFRELASPIE
jgi:hypothetical protein